MELKIAVFTLVITVSVDLLFEKDFCVYFMCNSEPVSADLVYIYVYALTPWLQTVEGFSGVCPSLCQLTST